VDLLDGLEVACFDLFDTLVRIDTSRLPAVRWNGSEIRSTVPVLHERVFAARGVAREDLVAALRALWTELRELREELKEEPASPDGPWLEIPAVEKYRRLGRRLGIAADAELDALAREIADVHHATLLAAAEALPGAAEVLARVRARGLRTALVSNWDHAAAGPPLLARTGLAALLDHVVISEAVGVRKPDPRIFRAALAPFDAEPAAALHVGDLASADAWGAGRLGFRTVWINRDGVPWPEPDPRPHVAIARIGDLLPLLA
jgi:putative hydrolase of the HAD superfamily